MSRMTRVLIAHNMLLTYIFIHRFHAFKHITHTLHSYMSSQGGAFPFWSHHGVEVQAQHRIEPHIHAGININAFGGCHVTWNDILIHKPTIAPLEAPCCTDPLPRTTRLPRLLSPCNIVCQIHTDNSQVQQQTSATNKCHTIVFSMECHTHVFSMTQKLCVCACGNRVDRYEALPSSIGKARPATLKMRTFPDDVSCLLCWYLTHDEARLKTWGMKLFVWKLIQ
jgi:hypothetical protein